MLRITALILALSLLLGGCTGFLDSSYVYVTPHQEQDSQTEEQIVSVSNYDSLVSTICDMVEIGTQSGIISVARYDQATVDRDMRKAIDYAMTVDPIGAYAVSDISYDLGTNAGQPAVALSITYIHDRSEIRKIQWTKNWSQAEEALKKALDNCESGIVLYLQDYEDVDFDQWVAFYAAANPERVIELPEVTANLYPDSGRERIVELKFTYQNSRDALRNMQTQVQRVFTSAVYYISSDASDSQKYSQLYAFLMERFEYKLETSITPAYSLLQHGVGDSKAFATVYAAMCLRAQLECITVTGTRAGEPWYWNIVSCDGAYYHVDLLRSSENDAFALLSDQEMTGYVWDYSAYPVCSSVSNEVMEE